MSPAIRRSHQSPRGREISAAAAVREAHWLATVLGVISAGLSMLGSAALAAAYLQTRTVPDIPGSSSGSGMSRNLETLAGAFYVASGLQVLALLAFAAAMIPSRKRRQTALFSLPMVVYVVAVLLFTGR